MGFDFSIPEHFTRGTLNGDDLSLFYYDIGLDNLQGFPDIYDWETVIVEFKDILDIDACESSDIPQEFVQNQIRFTLDNRRALGKEPKATAFFRHLRNAFSHYRIVREVENYVLTDERNGRYTMRGLVNAELLKQFCLRLFELRNRLEGEVVY